MFQVPCRLCGASIGDLPLHVAWHVVQGQDVSEAGAQAMKQLAVEQARHMGPSWAWYVKDYEEKDQ